MDKNYKIVEIPEVRCHQKLLKVLLDSLTSKGQCKIKSTWSFSNACVLQPSFRKADAWSPLVLSTPWRSFSGIDQLLLLPTTMLLLHNASSALETQEVVDVQAVEHRCVSKTAPTLSNCTRRSSVSCWAGGRLDLEHELLEVQARRDRKTQGAWCPQAAHAQRSRRQCLATDRSVLSLKNHWSLLSWTLIILLIRPVDGPRRRAQEEPGRMVDVPEGGRWRREDCSTGCWRRSRPQAHRNTQHKQRQLQLQEGLSKVRTQWNQCIIKLNLSSGAGSFILAFPLQVTVVLLMHDTLVSELNDGNLATQWHYFSLRFKSLSRNCQQGFKFWMKGTNNLRAIMWTFDQLCQK